MGGRRLLGHEPKLQMVDDPVYGPITGVSALQTSNNAGEPGRFLSLLRFPAVLIQEILHFVVPPGHFPADERSRNDSSGEVIVKECLDAEGAALLSRDIR